MVPIRKMTFFCKHFLAFVQCLFLNDAGTDAGTGADTGADTGASMVFLNKNQ